MFYGRFLLRNIVIRKRGTFKFQSALMSYLKGSHESSADLFFYENSSSALIALRSYLFAFYLFIFLEAEYEEQFFDHEPASGKSDPTNR